MKLRERFELILMFLFVEFVCMTVDLVCDCTV